MGTISNATPQSSARFRYSADHGIPEWHIPTYRGNRSYFVRLVHKGPNSNCHSVCLSISPQGMARPWVAKQCTPMTARAQQQCAMSLLWQECFAACCSVHLSLGKCGFVPFLPVWQQQQLECRISTRNVVVVVGCGCLPLVCLLRVFVYRSFFAIFCCCNLRSFSILVVCFAILPLFVIVETQGRSKIF